MENKSWANPLHRRCHFDNIIENRQILFFFCHSLSYGKQTEAKKIYFASLNFLKCCHLKENKLKCSTTNFLTHVPHFRDLMIFIFYSCLNLDFYIHSWILFEKCRWQIIRLERYLKFSLWLQKPSLFVGSSKYLFFFVLFISMLAIGNCNRTSSFSFFFLTFSSGFFLFFFVAFNKRIKVPVAECRMSFE